MNVIPQAIYTKLGSVTSPGSFHALTFGRYYFLEAPQNTGFPLAVFSIDGMDNDDQFGGSRVMRGSVSFDIYCESKGGAASAMTIEEALFTLLDQTSFVTGGSYGTVSMQALARGIPSVADEFIVISTTYALFTTRS